MPEKTKLMKFILLVSRRISHYHLKVVTMFHFRVEKQKIVGLGLHSKKVNGGAKELKQIDRRTNMNRT